MGPAGQDVIQVQPHTLRNAFLGGIFGIMLGAGLLSIREALNTRVRTAADVEEYLGMPLLGRLYEPQRGLRARDELAMIVTPDAPETEAFQLLATNIEFTNLDRGAKSFMVTSANPAEGKSTSVANLAVTFARSGKRVILVDLDLRRPVAHRFFGLSVSPGITEVTLGRAWLDDALTPTSRCGTARSTTPTTASSADRWRSCPPARCRRTHPSSSARRRSATCSPASRSAPTSCSSTPRRCSRSATRSTSRRRSTR